jgi:predicted NBD/HSP70 family sugar kinase
MKSLTFTRTANSNLQNKINKSIIFNYMRANGPCFRAQISKKLKISAPAVSRAIDSLMQEDYIIETDKIKTANGKWTPQYKINASRGSVIGIDLGKEFLQIALSDFSGKQIVKRHGFKIVDSINVADDIIEEIEVLLQSHPGSNGQIGSLTGLKAISIALPASIDPNSSAILGGPTFEQWRKLNIRELLSSKFNVPVYVENDVNLSALGEKQNGEGKNYSDVVFLEISYGIGAGTILNNHLLRGSFGYAGEVGCSIFNCKNLKFKVKDRGYLESRASFQSIRDRAIEGIRQGRRTLILDLADNDIDSIDPGTVCIAALRGDKFAENIIDDIVDLLSLLIINFILILNPQIILLGGDICSLPGVKTLFLQKIVNNVTVSCPFKMPEIKLSALGEDAGIIGASFFAIESLLVGEFPYTIDYEIFS